MAAVCCYTNMCPALGVLLAASTEACDVQMRMVLVSQLPKLPDE